MRERLFSQIGKNRAERPVLWLSGPAGSGKTTLVSSYIESSKLPCLWYQVDERDGDVASFFSCMGLAVKKARPAIRRPMPLFTPEYHMGLPAFSKNYFEEVYRRLRSPFTIVLDNYQDAPDESRLHEAMASGLAILPENITFLLISRSGPHPRLARLRASGRMGLIGWDEIRFTEDEIKDIVRDRLSGKAPEMPDEALAKLYAVTDGWIAGVILMLERMCVKGIDHIPEAEVQQTGVFDYFANEFFERVSNEVRQFLLKTAFLPMVSADMAGELTGMENAERILDDLSLGHYFTSRYPTGHPGQKTVYQYHPLFMDFLRHRAKANLSGGELAMLKKETAHLLAASGQTEDAAELFMGAGNWQGLIDLILSSAHKFIEQGRYGTLEKWIDGVPPDILESSPWLLYWKGACRMPFEPPRSLHFFERAFDLFSRDGDETGGLLSWSGAVEALMFTWDDLNPLDRWIDWLDDRQRRNRSFPPLRLRRLFPPACQERLSGDGQIIPV